MSLTKTLCNSDQSALIPNIIAFSIVTTCTGLGLLIRPYVDHSIVIMIYVLGVATIATAEPERKRIAIISALLSTILFDFFFIPPLYSFTIADIQYVVMLIVMIIVTQIISHLTSAAQNHANAMRNAKMQAETERLRNILLTSISHDLRTPLAAIMGSSSSLLQAEGNLSTIAKEELLTNIYEESKRLNHLVTNVLQMIRLEAGAIKINKQRWSLEDIISTALEILQEAIQRKQITIELNYAQVLPLIYLDHLLIEQVLVNLLDNAIKFSGSSGSITISTYYTSQSILIKICDKGPGIAPCELDKIFNKFYQRNTEDHCSGFGLGLAICKYIITMHKGNIWAENQPNGGAALCFTIPILE